MKKLIFSLAITYSLMFFPVYAQEKAKQVIQVSPEILEVGAKVSVRYFLQEGDSLQSSLALSFTGTTIKQLPIELKKTSNGVYEGNLILPDTASALVFSFSSLNSQERDGWYGLVHQNGGLVKGAYASLGYLYQGMGKSYAGMAKDQDSALKNFELELATYPQDSITYLVPYTAALVAKEKKEKAEQLVARFSDKYYGDEQASENNLVAVRLAYDQSLKDKTAADSLKEIIKTRFPNGQFVRTDLLNTIFRENDKAKKKELILSYMEQFPKEQYPSNYDNLYNLMANIALGEKDTLGFEQYAHAISSPLNKAQLYNQIAWPLAEKGEDLAFASGISKKSLDILKETIANPDASKPESYSATQWVRSLNSSYSMFADTYALLCYKQGNLQDALAYQKDALSEKGLGSGEINERYALYLKELGKLDELKEFASKAITAGKDNEALVSLYQEVYIGKHGEEKWNSHIAALKESHLTDLKKELQAQMIDKDAPKFSLLNLEGKEVSLESLKGKVVVVDFWATWCGPCKASFPAMQQAVINYKEKGDPVEFLFVNTWETVADRDSVVKKFIEDNQYSFHVLMDKEGKEKGDFDVVSAFGVSGIPTKFVVDKNGKIKFMAVGYSGNNGLELQKLGMMIELAGQGELAAN